MKKYTYTFKCTGRTAEITITLQEDGCKVMDANLDLWQNELDELVLDNKFWDEYSRENWETITEFLED